MGAGAVQWLWGCGRDRPLNRLETTPSGEGENNPPNIPVIPPEETPLAETFPMGVASGDVSAMGAMLWTRHGGSKRLECVVWEMDGERYAREAGRTHVLLEDAGYGHVFVEGLQPSRRYRYAFFEVDGTTRVTRSSVGRFRTPPADDAMEPLVVGAMSCIELGHSFAVLARAAERTDLDTFLLLGDTTYNDGARTLTEYRERWLASMSTPEWRALRSSTSVFATWDDHEVTNDWNPEEEDSDLVRAALRSWFENMPVRRGENAPNRVYRNLRWGRTVEFFALDCKTERKPSQKQYISREQLDWLKAGLRDSPAAFKIILNSVPIGEFPLPFTVVNGGRWEGYPEQRTEILSHVDKAQIPGVLWLSGDFHLGSMGRISATGPGSQALEVLAGPGAQNANPLLATVRGSNFDFVTGTNNYVALHLEPKGRDCRVVFHDGKGDVLAQRSYRL
jgi:alkaline phosphatase D